LLFAMFLLGAFAVPVSAAVLLVGYGSGDSEETARAAAQEDLAYKLQRLGARRLHAGSGKVSASVQRALVEGRELPLIRIEVVGAGADSRQLRFEARLTDASLAAYQREAGWLAERLRKLDPARIPAGEETATRLTEWFAWLDQYRRVHTVLSLFSSAARPEVEWDEAALRHRAVKNLSPLVSTKDVARLVKAEVDRARVSGVRIIAPVRADNSEVTGLSGSIADELRSLVSTPGEAARYTLDGRYERIDGRILLTLFLMDATFNTERVFMFALPAATEQSFRALPAAGGFAETLSRGLVRIDSLDQGVGPIAGIADKVMGVDVRTERGQRGLYYRPGDRDRLLVKLDRPGYYYIVGHVEKANTHFSYLMEIGEPGGNRFVRRVSAEGANRWQTIGEFTVEPPLGLEAVQVFATSEPPDRALPPARLDPARKLYVIGVDPIETIKRTRGLVLVNMAGAAADTGPGRDAAQAAIGEAVLQFSTLQ
jgi:hypothetical protein